MQNFDMFVAQAQRETELARIQSERQIDHREAMRELPCNSRNRLNLAAFLRRLSEIGTKRTARVQSTEASVHPYTGSYPPIPIGE